MQCMRCGLLLHVSHLAWSSCLSVCACVFGTWISCAKRLNRSRCRFRDWRREPCARWRSHVRRSIITNLRMANMPAQRTWRRNVFAAASGDKTAMRPFAKLLWTLPSLFYHSARFAGCRISVLTTATTQKNYRNKKSTNWWKIVLDGEVATSYAVSENAQTHTVIIVEMKLLLKSRFIPQFLERPNTLPSSSCYSVPACWCFYYCRHFRRDTQCAVDSGIAS